MTTRPRLTLVALLTALMVLPALPSMGALAPGGTFTDDDGNTHEASIEAIAAAGVTKGCNPPFGDRYCPAQEVTRGEMAAFLRRAMGLPASAVDHFIDDDGTTFEADIDSIAAAGIAKGCNPPANTRFCQNRVVRRGEMAAFLRRALGLPASNVDHFVDDQNSTFQADIDAIADAGITKGCNPPANDRFCPDAGVRRDEMASFLARAFGFATEKPAARPPLDWDLVVGGLASPIQVVAPPGENRLLVAEQGGLVRVVQGGAIQPAPFLDIRDDVVFAGERGLLSIALHPGYPAVKRMYAWYYGAGDRTYLVEYDIANDLQSASSPRTVLTVAQPAANHNGGFLAFGEDGYLYLSTGDGGGGNNSYNTSRNLNSLLGKILRLDVDGGSPYDIPSDNPYVGAPGRDEIWASGLRNPWRWSFSDGYMFIGDVGQSTREEIDAVPVSPVGYDFGWSRYEGSVCNPNDADPSCASGGLTFPVVEYGRSVGHVVTGGIVYHGPTVRSLDRFYLYADVSSGRVRAFRLHDGRAVESVDLTSKLGMGGIVSFAEDQTGELLVVAYGGAVYRLVGG